MAAAPQPRLRADALRNRERIISAAREALVEHGAESSLDEIARRAGVGNATLYRHFADRRELIHHVTLSVMARLADRAEVARAEEPDAFLALRRFVHAAADERIGALCPLLAEGVDKSHVEHIAARERLDQGIEALMAAARAAGQLRADISVGDLMVAITQLTRPLPGTGCMNFDQFVHRHLQIFLDGLMAPARSQLPGAAVTLEDLRQK
ncbi:MULTISPECIES: TetR/AcrR family transcriptional regulator [Streptomyces]|uniref:TetR/AcrR family transcriptional regulator n=1 Tax=Streptomyces morookaense TaxID=1970 RepID=A0A7Y7B539_STRMO|nr:MULTISPECIES: TetR/AcrR family transcriptional regulator [Streptomyces]MCC2278373.1 TetR/AcrR family transcriptional regulator [Streptomyces sp. ET3-23]NVK79044.1 TetR/AcrR family transcriptional regulator [Streptomyces morookaense]GHF09929.1 TetR family transcriptional regulator [Streptomyces morookaense]